MGGDEESHGLCSGRGSVGTQAWRCLPRNCVRVCVGGGGMASYLTGGGYTGGRVAGRAMGPPTRTACGQKHHTRSRCRVLRCSCAYYCVLDYRCCVLQ
eukprot:358495-Chlamydomonas_euryale.AAC.8